MDEEPKIDQYIAIGDDIFEHGSEIIKCGKHSNLKNLLTQALGVD